MAKKHVFLKQSRKKQSGGLPGIIIIKPLLTSLTVLVVFGNQTVQMTIHFKYLKMQF